MLNEPWWYWLAFALFVLGALMWLAAPLAAKWEQRQDRRDAQLWADQFGGDIYSRKVDR